MDENAVQEKMKFRRIGGNYQLSVEHFSDLPAVLALDDAFWAINSIDIDSLRMERRFLDFVDTDRNGKIRTDEVRSAVRFLVDNLRSGKGFDEGSSELELDAVNPDGPAGKGILQAAKAILFNIGKPDAKKLSLEELRNDKEIKSCTCHNGDGVITPAPDQSQEMNDRIQMIIKAVGSAADLSGTPGVNLELIEKFLKDSSAYLAYKDTPSSEPDSYLVFGDDTEEIHSAYLAIKDAVDGYFLNSETLSFFDGDPDRMAKKDLTADVRAPKDVRTMLEKTALATPRADKVLDLAAPLNPLFAEQVRGFFALKAPKSFLSGNTLSAGQWKNFKAKLAKFDAWHAGVPESAAVYSAFDEAELRKAVCDELTQKLKKLCEEDLSCGAALAGVDALHQLMVYQRDMKKFLNNFISLTELFDKAGNSPLQQGKLVMDGRHFTLAVPVRDMAEHKKLVERSNICVLYIELSGRAVLPPVKNLAVAVTSGNMRNLFSGKRGVFFGADGNVYDAKVIAFVEQPVSIREALKNPFYRFGSFIGEQLNKLFVSRTATAQKELGAQIASGKLAAPAPAAAKAPVPAPGNPSMLLMGGGIGLAALGSSVAFITKQLQNVSLWNVFSVIVGILLIFGGPLIMLSLVKLYTRDLARFLEAAGCAVNRKMRLSCRMGGIFTYAPPLPVGTKIRGELINSLTPGKGNWLWIWKTLLILVLAALCIFGGISLSAWLLPRPGNVPVKCEKKPVVPAVHNKK